MNLPVPIFVRLLSRQMNYQQINLSRLKLTTKRIAYHIWSLEQSKVKISCNRSFRSLLVQSFQHYKVQYNQHFGTLPTPLRNNQNKSALYLKNLKQHNIITMILKNKFGTVFGRNHGWPRAIWKKKFAQITQSSVSRGKHQICQYR